MFVITKAITGFVFCAWILWQQNYINDKKMGFDIIDAFNTQEECHGNLSNLNLRKNKREKKAETILRSDLICLPDTVKLN